MNDELNPFIIILFIIHHSSLLFVYLSDLSIRQPVFTTMVISALIVLGVVSLSLLSVERFPDVFPPVVLITVFYPGSSAEEIESLITKSVEDAVAPLPGVTNIFSTSGEGVSEIKAEFALETPKDQAANRIREALSATRHILPQGIEEPRIQRFDPASQPMMMYALMGTKEERTVDQIRSIIQRYIKPRLESIEGVASIEIVGGLEREIQIKLNPNELAVRGIPFQLVIDRITEETSTVPGGRIRERKGELVLRTRGEVTTFEQLDNLVLKYQEGAPIYLKDVGFAYDFYKEIRLITRVNRDKAVAFGVRRQQGSNALAVAQNVKTAMEELSKTIPSDTDVLLMRDDSIRIASSVQDVYYSLLIGTGLVILTVFLFMRDWRSTIIISLTLPTAVVATFTFLYFQGYSINLMTLMGLSLAIGLIVDDAIVVRENIFRHMEMGKNPFQAAREGTAEVGLAVMASTFTIVAVFIPVVFMTGASGRFYKELGLTVIISVLLSLFIAFTLDPMLSSRFMRVIAREKGKDKRTIQSAYEKSLKWALDRRGEVLYGAAVIFLLSLLLIPIIGTEFLPTPDSGEFSVLLELPQGSTIGQMNDVMFDVEEFLDADWHKNYPPNQDIQDMFAIVGSPAGVERAEVKVRLKPPSERKLAQRDIIDQLRKDFPKFPGLQVGFIPVGAFGEEIQESPILLHVRGERLEILRSMADSILKMFVDTPGTADIKVLSARRRQEFRMKVDQEKVADFGLSVKEVANTLRSMVEGVIPAKLREGGHAYDIRVHVQEAERRTTEDLGKLTILTPQGEKLQLNDIATFDYSAGINWIERLNRTHQVTIASQIAEGRSLGDVVDALRVGLAQIDFPPGYTYTFGSQVRQMVESFRSLYFAIFLAIIFIYMVLASQFGSFIHPFTIMLSLPLAVIGMLLGLFIGNQTINMMSLIGMLLLMGLVTKNAILLIEFAITLQEQGLFRREAVISASLTRLRPILMTSLTTIFGAVPLALGWGSEFEIRQPMAMAIIGGMISSTILTLLVIPLVYTFIDEKIEKWSVVHRSS
jgi:HAE1 family hydrophobic/amphiphilic exporter-1